MFLYYQLCTNLVGFLLGDEAHADIQRGGDVGN